MPEPHVPPTPRHSDELEALLRNRTRARGRRRRAVLGGVPVLLACAVAAGGWALTQPGDPDVTIVVGGPNRTTFRADPKDLPEDLPPTLRTMLIEGTDTRLNLGRLRRLTTFQDNDDRYEMWIAPNAGALGNQVLVGGSKLSFGLSTLQPGNPCFPKTYDVGVCSAIGGNASFPVIGWTTAPRVRAIFDRGPGVVARPKEGLYLVGGGPGRTLIAVVAEDEAGRELDVAPTAGAGSNAPCAATSTDLADIVGAGTRVARSGPLTVGGFRERRATVDVGPRSTRAVPLVLSVEARGPQSARIRMTRIDGLPGIAVFGLEGGAGPERRRDLVFGRGEGGPVDLIVPGAGCYLLSATWPGGRADVTIRARAQAPSSAQARANRPDGRFGYARGQLPEGLPAGLLAYLDRPGLQAAINPASLRRRVTTPGPSGARHELWTATGSLGETFLAVLPRPAPSVIEVSPIADPRTITLDRCPPRSDGLPIGLCFGEGTDGLTHFGRVIDPAASVEGIDRAGRRRAATVSGGYFLLAAETGPRAEMQVLVARAADGRELARLPAFGPGVGDLGTLAAGMAIVPQVSALSVAEATRLIRARGLRVRVSVGPRDGVVTNTDPFAGAGLARGQVVELATGAAKGFGSPERFGARPRALDVPRRTPVALSAPTTSSLRQRAVILRSLRPVLVLNEAKYYLAESAAAEICLVRAGAVRSGPSPVRPTEGDDPLVLCGAAGWLARDGALVRIPPHGAARLVEALVADGLTSAEADDGKQVMIVGNILSMPVAEDVRTITLSGPAGEAVIRLE